MQRFCIYLLTLLAALSPFALAYPEITLTATSFDVTDTIVVTWTDQGTAPTDSLLTTFTLTLYVGGNSPGTDAGAIYTVTTAGEVSAGTYSASVAAAVALAGDTALGFYFQMNSVASEGGIMTTYSPRFTLTGMTGTTGTTYLTAAKLITSATDVPAVTNGVGTSADATTAGDSYEIPYQSQTGLTKYAAMQSLPPTKITAKSYTPMYPTSAYTLATTFLEAATILTTLTELVTYSVSSMENTIAAASQPTDDMAKFLKRWKD